MTDNMNINVIKKYGGKGFAAMSHQERATFMKTQEQVQKLNGYSDAYKKALELQRTYSGAMERLSAQLSQEEILTIVQSEEILSIFLYSKAFEEKDNSAVIDRIIEEQGANFKK